MGHEHEARRETAEETEPARGTAAGKRSLIASRYPARARARGTRGGVPGGEPTIHGAVIVPIAGRWYRRDSFGPTAIARETAGAVAAVDRQHREGNVADLIDRFESMVATQRHQAVAQGVIRQEMYAAWDGLCTALTQLRPSVLRAAGAPGAPDATLQAAAARHADALARLLTEATRDHGTELRELGRAGYRQRSNPYTGEIEEREGSGEIGGGRVTYHSGAAIEIAGDIRGDRWAQAYAHYARLTSGLDHWIADELERRFGPAGKSAAWQLGVLGELRAAEAYHPGVRRVQAVFVADSSYDSHADYNTYRQIPLYLLLWRDGTRWRLRDISNPEHPFEGSHEGGDAQKPDPALFSELDDVRHFPRGVVRYDVPGGGPSGRVETTERRTWVDHVSYAAMIPGDPRSDTVLAEGERVSARGARG
ncbi:MAG TPA: hypothetical protein VNO30_34705 [Kofleriaceae bacterium]|nr:hypothetical protein [Kofleriaceae bacterium]